MMFFVCLCICLCYGLLQLDCGILDDGFCFFVFVYSFDFDDWMYIDFCCVVLFLSLFIFELFFNDGGDV